MLLIYATVSLAIVLAAVYIFIISFAHQPRRAIDSELYYTTNDGSGKAYPLPATITSTSFETSKDDEKVSVSVVVPCYNETKRLGVMLEESVQDRKSVV